MYLCSEGTAQRDSEVDMGCVAVGGDIFNTQITLWFAKRTQLLGLDFVNDIFFCVGIRVIKN